MSRLPSPLPSLPGGAEDACHLRLEAAVPFLRCPPAEPCLQNVGTSQVGASPNRNLSAAPTSVSPPLSQVTSEAKRFLFPFKTAR